MRHSVLMFCGACALLSSTNALSQTDPLLEEFRNPPASARPRVWWHWLNGNITQEGIDQDLQWMKRVGIGGVQNFDASMGTPQVVDKRLVYMTPEWNEAFQHAARRANEYGLEMAIAASPGWSHTGGPWVTPPQAMKKLVWSETTVDGGRRFSGILAAPPRIAGPFQDIPVTDLLGSTERPPEHYADVAVLAFPVTRDEAQVRRPRVTTSDDRSTDVFAALTDGQWSTSVKLKLGGAEPCITHDFERPVPVASLTLTMPTASDFFRSSLATPRVEYGNDGAAYTKIAEMPSGGFEQHTVSFAPVEARYFSVCFGPPAPPSMSVSETPAPGANMALLPFGSAKHTELEVNELRLFSAARIHRFEHKAVFALAPDYYALASPDATAPAIDSSRVVDLTSRMHRDGRLDWVAPAGRWKIVRFGYSLTGKKNHPASAEATGLEVDKLSREHVRNYLDRYLGNYDKALGNERLRALLVDSIETGAQNWTETLPQEFKRRRGYDVLPWLPALTGAVIRDAASSDRFLYDYRRTLSELIAENLYAEIARAAKDRGLLQYGEALEAGRPVMGDDLDMRRYADVPMAAMWTYPNTATGPAPTAVADIRGAASVAHMYGQNLVAAESLTSAFAPWAFAPRDLKPMIDAAFVLGVNRPVIHTSVHQPLIDKAPGLTLAIFGQYFNRNETWAEQARPWVDYLARTSHLLQQGLFVADVLYFHGEEAPLTAQYAGQVTPDAPQRYGFDFANAEIVLNQLRVENGRLIAPSGISYRALYLGGTSARMTLPVLRKLEALVAQGAKVIGHKPIASPSLSDDAATFTQTAERLWGGEKIVGSSNLDQVLASMGVPPDFEFKAATTDAEIKFLHRRLADGDVYFLTNRRNREERVDAAFRVVGKRPEIWRADTATVQPVSYRIEGERTLVPLRFAPQESYFLVFRAPTSATAVSVADPTVKALTTLDGDWSVTFQSGRGVATSPVKMQAGTWTDNSSDAVRHFSGTATYARTLDVPRAWKGEGRLILDLGDVRELAEVLVNGRSIGIAWHPPFRVDVTDVLVRGKNQLEIRVTNLWVNRLIGDAQPGAQRITFTTDPPYVPEAPLRASGLLGPVKLELVTQARH